MVSSSTIDLRKAYYGEQLGYTEAQMASKSLADLEREFFEDPPEGGGAVGDSKPYLWAPPAAPNAKDDEFNDGVNMSGPVNGLDSQWTKHNLGTAGWTVLNDAIAPGCVMLDIPTGQAADQQLFEAAPAGDFTLYSRLSLVKPSDRHMIGISILDANGDGVGVLLDNGDTNINARTIDNWLQTGTATAVGASNTVGQEGFNGFPIQLFLKKVGDNFSGAASWNDRLIVPTFTAIHAITSFVPAFISVGRFFGTGSVKILVDAFRVY